VRLPGRPLARRVAGWLGIDGNPLRRRTDRLESAVRLVLLLVFLTCGPLLASLTGRLAHTAGLHQVRQQQTWRQVAAVLLRPAPLSYYAYSSMTTYRVPARWLAPSGAIRVGQVSAPAGLRAGAAVRVWVNADGQVTGRRPLTARAVALRSALAEIVTLAGLGAALLIMTGLVRWQLDRRRLAAWAIEWAALGPRWTTRH
jgi:hypothetical protein